MKLSSSSALFAAVRRTGFPQLQLVNLWVPQIQMWEPKSYLWVPQIQMWDQNGGHSHLWEAFSHKLFSHNVFFADKCQCHYFQTAGVK